MIRKLLLGFLLLIPLSTRADSVYDFKGTLTLFGNNACNGVCTETINFNFRVDYNACGLAHGCNGPSAPGQTLVAATILPGFKLTSTGPLAGLSQVAVSFMNNNAIFSNASGDFIDLLFQGIIGSNPFGTGPVGPWLGGLDGTFPGDCLTHVCKTDFWLPGNSGGTLFGQNLCCSSTLQYTVKPDHLHGLGADPPAHTPEPATALMLLAGLSALFLAKWRPPTKSFPAATKSRLN